jgi:hypothetical protein
MGGSCVRGAELVGFISRCEDCGFFLFRSKIFFIMENPNCAQKQREQCEHDGCPMFGWSSFTWNLYAPSSTFFLWCWGLNSGSKP